MIRLPQRCISLASKRQLSTLPKRTAVLAGPVKTSLVTTALMKPRYLAVNYPVIKRFYNGKHKKGCMSFFMLIPI